MREKAYLTPSWEINLQDIFKHFFFKKECGPDARSHHPQLDRRIGPFQSSDNSMVVEFRSDDEQGRDGWSAKLSLVQCGEIVLLEKEYTLTIPTDKGQQPFGN